MQIKISVVIPTYKRPELLARCLAALSRQSLDHKDFEVIIVSDGPDLQTERLLKAWMEKNTLHLSYLWTPEKKGPAGARNMGWLHARAALIAFTDDDCIPDPDWLKVFTKKFSKQPLLAYTGKTVVPQHDRTISDVAQHTADFASAEFMTANCACTKKALLLIGGFDERFKLAWREDIDLQFRLIGHQIPIVSLEKAIVCHPLRYATWGISIKEQKKGIYDALLFKKHPELYREKIKSYPVWIYYTTIMLWLILLLSLHARLFTFTWSAAVLLIVFIALFLEKRLRNTDRSAQHITEMVITSILIPFLSVFWRIYGAIKFRVLFI